MTCKHCANDDGTCLYPWYGVAPHVHAPSAEQIGDWIGSTRLMPKNEWPSVAFVEDSEIPGLGTYLYCTKCGDSRDHAVGLRAAGGKE